MDLSGFMHKCYDWSAFETFVRDLYVGDGDATVQHNVIETDRYGAKRQIDVKIVRRSRFHRFTTLIECKRWKEPVGRDRIDVLASSIEALGASNGAIFTTTGFEEGAIAYAKGKGIEPSRGRGHRGKLLRTKELGFVTARWLVHQRSALRIGCCERHPPRPPCTFSRAPPAPASRAFLGNT